MKQPKKVKKQPDPKRRLEQVTPAQEPDIPVIVALPAWVYRAIEATAGGDVEGWVRVVVIETVEGEFAADDAESPTDS